MDKYSSVVVNSSSDFLYFECSFEHPRCYSILISLFPIILLLFPKKNSHLFYLLLFQVLCNCSSTRVSIVYDKSNRIFYVGECMAFAGFNFVYANLLGLVHNNRIAKLSS